MSWRDTLFVWRGDMEYGENAIRQYAELLRNEPMSEDATYESFTWKGRWVGVDAADATKADMPPVRDWRDGANGFESDNLFHVVGGPPPIQRVPRPHKIPSRFTILPSSRTRPIPDHYYLPEARKYDHVGWQLDNGDGHKWYRDTVHEMRCCGDDVVFARGHNQFAPFIAVGFLSGYRFTKVRNSITATGLQNRTLTVARRYLDDGDERCGWSMDDLEREVRAGMASSVPTHPWMVECMGSAKRKKRKR